MANNRILTKKNETFSLNMIFNLIVLSCLLLNIFITCQAQLTELKPGTTLQIQDTLVSPKGLFTLAFYRRSGSGSDYWYLAVRYTNDGYNRLVWVGNRNMPLTDIKGNLTLDASGILKITGSDGNQNLINSATTASKNSRASLTDSGNFVLEEVSTDGSTSVVRVLWQSFDGPVDTLLPGMKLGINFTTGRNWSLSSWTTSDIAAPGAFSLEWDWKETQLVMRRRGEMYWTSGKLHKQTNVFPNISWLTQDGHPNDYNFNYVSNEESSYFYYSITTSRVSWLGLGYDGSFSDTDKPIFLLADACYGYVSDEAVSGCVDQTADKCREVGGGGAVDNFTQTRGYFRTPRDYDGNASLGLSDCWARCWNNCSCIAYNNVNSNGTGCSFWGVGSIFTPSSSSEEVYVLNSVLNDGSSGNKWWIWVIIALVVVVVALLLAWLFYVRKRKHKEEMEKQEEEILLELTTSKRFNDSEEIGIEGNKGREVKLFSFAAISAATNNFSLENKLGQGGFGPVYKGELPDGRKIAVKRLSKGSGQGLIEFKNEIVLIAKLQHTNLVRLFGCCIQGDDEKMLIYEYMPNKSLDFFLFDPTKKDVLNWQKRYDIIEGIAQGLLYLHKYSRFRIIHRDLKVSNILLDEQMNPKIADFGLARIFGRNVKEETTKRVVGTYGYMSPEYAMEGIFSEKSDVYSFGVLMLEIVSGKKNNSFYQYDRPMTIVSYAWQLWRENNAMEMVDSSISLDLFEPQIKRCIQVSLLCVQERVNDRPTMSDVISMLTNETMPIPTPNEPVSISQSNVTGLEDTDSHGSKIYSSNDVTLTVMEPR